MPHTTRLAALVLVLLLSATPLLGAAPAAADAPPAAGWQTPQMVSTFDSTSAESPDVAANSAGDAVLVWSQSTGGNNRVWAREYSATTGWSTSTLVESTSLQTTFSPRAAIDPDGRAVAVWNQFTGSHYDVWAARFVPATGWEAPVLLETESTYDALAPDVALGADGSGAATWEQDNGTFYDIWASLFDPVTGWSTPALLESGNAGDAYGPRAAVDGDGVVTVAWYQSGATHSEIIANRFTPGSGWSGATPVSSADPYNADAVRVASGASGDVVAVWEQGNGTGNHIFASHFGPGSGWSSPVQIENYTYGGIAPDVTMDDSGRAVAAWVGLDGTHAVSVAAAFDPSTGWGPATDILPATGQDQFSVQVSASPAGDAFAIWVQDTGSHRDVWASRFVPGDGWQGSDLVEKDNGGDASYVYVAADGAGNAFAAWAQYDGVQENAWAARYIAPDTTAPALSVSEPADATHVNGSSVRVSGTTESTATVSVNGVRADVSSTGAFSLLVPLAPGDNTVAVSASDAGGTTVVSRDVVSDDPSAGLADALNATEADLAQTQSDLAAAQSDLAAAQSSLNNLTGMVSDLEAQLAAANARAAAAEANATALDARVGTLESAPAAGGDIVPLLVAVVALVVGGLAVALTFRRPGAPNPTTSPATGKPEPTAEPPEEPTKKE